MWLSSQNIQTITQYVIKVFTLTLLGVAFVACSDINIYPLALDNQKSLQRISVVDDGTRNGQLYGRELRKILHVGGKSNEAYGLTSTIETTSSNTLSVQGASSNLKKMSMKVSFILTDLSTGNILFKDEVVGGATLGVVTSHYGEDKSEIHASERLSILLARRVVRRLQLYFLNQTQ